MKSTTATIKIAAWGRHCDSHATGYSNFLLEGLVDEDYLRQDLSSGTSAQDHSATFKALSTPELEAAITILTEDAHRHYDNTKGRYSRHSSCRRYPSTRSIKVKLVNGKAVLSPAQEAKIGRLHNSLVDDSYLHAGGEVNHEGPSDE